MLICKMMNSSLDFLVPDWPAPQNVKALMTTRKGGVSVAPFNSLNLGAHVGDDPHHVNSNRNRLSRYLPAEPMWLNQVHGKEIFDASHVQTGVTADGLVTTKVGKPICVMTADCLPVLMCNRQGTKIAVVHAGWRGLAYGILENAIGLFNEPSEIYVWLGAAIGRTAFEVGHDVLEVFSKQNIDVTAVFIDTAKPNKYCCDLYQLARMKLNKVGVYFEHIYGGGECTFNNSEHFFSYRREGQTGRMAACMWLD